MSSLFDRLADLSRLHAQLINAEGPHLEPPEGPDAYPCSQCDGTGTGYAADRDGMTYRAECGRCGGTGLYSMTEREAREIRDQERLDERLGK